MEIRSDRRFRFDVGRSSVWAAIARVERYTDWWPWLRHFDGEALRAGETWRCAVEPPLPYTLRFDIELVDVIEGEQVKAQIVGDIAGRARLAATGHGSQSEIRLVSDLRPNNALLQLVTVAARPLVMFDHDWVLDTGARQFRASAFEDRQGNGSVCIEQMNPAAGSARPSSRSR